MANSLSLFSLIVLFILINPINSSPEDDSRVRSERRSSINDDRPFRMNKLNLIFQKAKRTLPEDVLPRLYSDFLVQDQLEIEWKKQKASGLDEDGEQEALIRRKFIGILYQFDLLDVYSNDFGKVEKNVLDSDEKHIFAEALKRDKKLAKLWKKAEMSAFSEQELEVLKAEFSHHMQKIAEYEQLKKDINRIEGISENSIEGFRMDGAGHVKLREKHSGLKQAYSNVKESLEYLEKRTAEGSSSESFFKDSRIGELWQLALSANLSVSELESFQDELKHFEHKINKHDYFLKQAEMANVHGSESEAPEFYQQLQERVEGYASSIKKWYRELKMRVSKTAELRDL